MSRRRGVGRLVVVLALVTLVVTGFRVLIDRVDDGWLLVIFAPIGVVMAVVLYRLRQQETVGFGSRRELRRFRRALRDGAPLPPPERATAWRAALRREMRKGPDLDFAGWYLVLLVISLQPIDGTGALDLASLAVPVLIALVGAAIGTPTTAMMQRKKRARAERLLQQIGDAA